MQEMYLQSVSDGHDLHQVRAAEVTAKLDALVTTEVLAATRPPASFPVPTERPRPRDLAPAVHEIAELQRRALDGQLQLEKAVRERDALRNKLEQCEVWRA